MTMLNDGGSNDPPTDSVGQTVTIFNNLLQSQSTFVAKLFSLFLSNITFFDLNPGI